MRRAEEDSFEWSGPAPPMNYAHVFGMRDAALVELPSQVPACPFVPAMSLTMIAVPIIQQDVVPQQQPGVVIAQINPQQQSEAWDTEADQSIRLSADGGERIAIGYQDVNTNQHCSHAPACYFPPTMSVTVIAAPIIQQGFVPWQVQCVPAVQINGQQQSEAWSIEAELSARLSAGGHLRKVAIASGHQDIKTDQHWSRAWQQMLVSAANKDKAELAELVQGFRGHVRECSMSMHGSHVIEKIVELSSGEASSFVIEEMLGFGTVAANHKFACRVLCRLLEHNAWHDTSALVAEVLEDGHMLSRAKFGTYVVQHILEHGSPQHKNKVVSILCTSLQELARNKFGCIAIQKTLEYNGGEYCKAFFDVIFHEECDFVALAQRQFGRFVVKALLSLPNGYAEYSKRAADLLRPSEAQLSSSKYGKTVADMLAQF